MKSLALVSVLILLPFASRANDEAAADPDLPQPLDTGIFESLMTHSPFSRSVNLEDTLRLTGIAYVDGHPVATVVNTETKQRFVVTEQPNAQGWRLTGATNGADLASASIEMMVGPELVTMHYTDTQITPESSGSRGRSGSLMASGGSSRKDGGEKFRASSFLGEKGHELYGSLSPDARDKFKDALKAHVEKHREETPEQNSAYAQKLFAKIKEADHSPSSGSSSVKSPKVSKPSKKKQGA